MNIVYCHIDAGIGDMPTDAYSQASLPSYFFLSARQSRFFNPNAKIYLVCNSRRLQEDDNTQLGELLVDVVDQQQLMNDKVMQFARAYRLSSYDKRLMLFNFTGICRYFLVESLMKEQKLEDVFQLESDNLVYEDLDSIKHIFNSNCMMSKVNDDRMCCGAAFFKDAASIGQMNDMIIKTLRCKQLKYVNDMFILADIFKHTQLISVFSAFPDTNVIFDPCSYGQFLSGTNNGHQAGFIDLQHDIGKFMSYHMNELKFYKENRGFFVKWRDHVCKFASLHIHNKKAIKDFVTYE